MNTMKKNYISIVLLAVITFATLTNTKAQKKWVFTNGFDGWSRFTTTGWPSKDSSKCVTNAQIDNGAIRIDFTCGDAYIYSPVINMSASNNLVKVRMKNPTPSTGSQIYFITGDNPDYINVNNGNTFHVEFPISSYDTDFQDYTIDMSVNPDWTGNIIQFRVDPANNTENSSVYLESVELTYYGASVHDLSSPQNAVQLISDPSSKTITISSNQKEFTPERINIYDINGKLVISLKANETDKQIINVEQLEKGMYSVQVIGQATSISKKVIIH